MTKRDVFIFLFTFLTGVFAGMYVYVTSYKPNYAVEDLSQLEQGADEFNVIGERYGGMRIQDASRPSFRLLQNGEYTFFVGDNEKRGRVPKALMRELLNATSETNFVLFSQTVSKDMCANYVDGSDYTYRITTEGEQYVLDTCTTNFDHGDALEETLLSVWEYIENPSSYTAGPTESASSFLERKLGEQFDLTEE